MKKTLVLFFVATAFAVAHAQTAIPTPAIPEAQPPAIAVPVAPSSQAPVESNEAPDATNKGMSFKEAWGYGGWIMWVLLACSVFAGAHSIYMLVVFRESLVVPARIVKVVRAAILENDDKSARRTCEDHPGAFSAMAVIALDCIRSDGGEDLRDLVQSEGARRVESMQSKAQLLLDISAIAPMLGLLGTTLGMLQAFGSFDMTVAAKPVVLAQGVSKAIVTTIAGLIVAIPCMMLYAFFRRKVSMLAGLLEKAADEITTAMATRKESDR